MPAYFNRNNLHLVPEFWEYMYPITFYYIGAYINEYRINMYKYKYGVLFSLAGIILICLSNPIFNWIFIESKPMVQIAGDPFGIFGVIISTLTFLILYQIPIKYPIIKNSFKSISLLSLDMYLCCYIFDKLYYPFFIEKYYINQILFSKYFFIIVPLIFYIITFYSSNKENIIQIYFSNS